MERSVRSVRSRIGKIRASGKCDNKTLDRLLKLQHELIDLEEQLAAITYNLHALMHSKTYGGPQ